MGNRAISAFARTKIEALGRKAIYALQRIPASGIYGDEPHSTVWDEYCFEVQQGPTELLEYAWQSLTAPIFDSIAEAVDLEEAVILTLYAGPLYSDEWDYDREDTPDRDSKAIAAAIEDAVKSTAINRDLTRLDQRRPRRRVSRTEPSKVVAVPSSIAASNLAAAAQHRWDITLAKTDFVAAIAIARTRSTLRRTGIKLEGNILFTQCPAGLSIRSSQAAFDVVASGIWSSPIISEGAAIRRVSSKLSGPTVRLVYTGGRLFFEHNQFDRPRSVTIADAFCIQERDNMNDVSIVIRAAVFAAERHRHQRRKDADASPYINHPLALAAILAVEGGISDPTILAAALLHDTVEDTDTTPDEIEAEFGSAVAAIVAEVTDDKRLTKVERKRRQIVTAAAKSTGAKLVKLADKTANVRDIAATPPADWSTQRRQDYFDWAQEVVAGLRGTNAALERAFDAACASRPVTV